MVEQTRAVPTRLRDAADLFERRNKEYGNNYKIFGRVMRDMFPNGLSAKTEEEFARLIHLAHLITKLTRYSMNFDRGGHRDSLEDMSVYAQMLAEIDDEWAIVRESMGQANNLVIPIAGSMETDIPEGARTATFSAGGNGGVAGHWIPPVGVESGSVISVRDGAAGWGAGAGEGRPGPGPGSTFPHPAAPAESADRSLVLPAAKFYVGQSVRWRTGIYRVIVIRLLVGSKRFAYDLERLGSKIVERNIPEYDVYSIKPRDEHDPPEAGKSDEWRS